MIVDGRLRVLVLMETPWDRKQLACCRDSWEGRFELAFPPPDDLSCPSDFDLLDLVERAGRGELGRIDGVISSSDYPGATLAAAIATRLGRPGSRPEDVVAASHKWYSRLAQQEAAPEAVPRFALLDPRTAGRAPAPLPFPFFVKPVKGAFSVLARRVDDADQLASFLSSAAVREYTDDYLRIFNQLVAALTPFDVDGRFFIAEELIGGQPVTVEGFVCDGEAELLGIVDSIVHPVHRSFLRFDYPSSLPPTVQDRMGAVARRVVARLGLRWTLFNIEMTWDPSSDRITIVEVNPRMCGQFADLYAKVDGTSSYEVALAVCAGDTPHPRRLAGAFAAASSVPLRVFEKTRVLRAPDPEAVAAVEAEFPGTLVWSECAAGDLLVDFDAEDGRSLRYAVLNLGAAERNQVAARVEAVRSRLGFAFERA